MKRNSILILSLFFATLRVTANESSDRYAYEIKCDNQKLISISNNDDSAESEECKTFLKQGFDKCYDAQKKNKDAKKITISTPIDHYYKSKESNLYSKEVIQQVIDIAVKTGTDPYLALAVVLMESPPILGDEHHRNYSNLYGRPPVDAIAVADYFDCKYKYNRSARELEFSNLPSINKTSVSDNSNKKNICLRNTYPGGSAKFEYIPKADSSLCCKKFKFDHDFADNERIPFIYKSQIVSNASAYYLKNRFEYAFGTKTSQDMAPDFRMSMIAQAYNGYGKFGVTEKMKNKCLQNMNFNESPLYGAGASDLMLNSLLANSQVRGLVRDSLKSNKKGDYPKSYLCASYGDGEHKVSAYTFSKQIKQYVGKSSKCPKHTYRVKSNFAEDADEFSGERKVPDMNVEVVN